MNSSEIESRLRRNFKRRNLRLLNAVQNDARRASETARRYGERCGICARAERGGGLSVFRMRDGSELLAGGRCAEYLDELVGRSQDAPRLLR
jgi:hypothetical protein